MTIPKGRAKGAMTGKMAPEFGNLVWFDKVGRPIKKAPTLKSARGKVIYLHFFQSWCPGCLSSGLPTIKEVSEHYSDNSKALFYAIQTVFEGFGSNTVKKVLSIKQRFKLNIPMAHDDGSREGLKKSIMMYKYRSRGTPWTVIIDPAGKVVFDGFHITAKAASTIIDQLLKSSK